MKPDLPTIRKAVPEDAPALLSIYAPYVTNTAVTFEYEVPAAEEFRRRIQDTLKRYPYLTAAADGQIVGYAYASAFHPRAAYSWCAETSVYVDLEYHGQGIGRELYLCLEQILKEQHILNLNACIAYPNPKSIAFHEMLGYRTAGHFHNCGFKLGRWYDMIWMEKILEGRRVPPLEVIPCRETARWNTL